jgi:dTDP-4-dehydrorhamnose reductase
MDYHNPMTEIWSQKNPQPERVLVLGASGLLGSRVYKVLSNKFETYGTYFRSIATKDPNIYELDATNYSELNTLIKQIQPNRIVNCLGLTDVEVCDNRPEASWKLNAEIPVQISRMSQEISAQFIHISTDHYYSNLEEPRDEMVPVKPINQYGFAKFAAENFIRFENSSALILRTNFFGISRKIDKSILNFAMNALSNNKFLDGFNDVFFAPVGVSDIAKFLLSDQSHSVTGLLNFASSDPISKYDFLKLIAQISGHSDELVREASIKDSKLTVPRPSYLALNPNRLVHQLGYPIPSLGEMLENEIAELN